MRQKIARALIEIREAVTSARGKELLLFLLFLMISYVFWLLLTLNNEVQEDIDLPVEFANVPDSVTIITDVPTSIKVSVRDKGSTLVRYTWGRTPMFKINWNDYKSSSDDNIVLTRTELSSRLRDYFGTGSQIMAISPDSIRISYTDEPGRRVPLIVKADISPALGCVVSGPIMANVDSVTLYAIEDLPRSLKSVSTVPVVRSGLKDTTSFEARIEPIAGVRIIPSRVTLTVPVEPLISRKQVAPVIVKNLPEGTGLITFPSQIQVSYLVPMSMYNSQYYDLKAYVDYHDVRRAKNSKIPITLSLIPEAYRNISVSPDSVEFIVEKKH